MADDRRCYPTLVRCSPLERSFGFGELLVDLMIELMGPTLIYSDSKSAIDMAFDLVAFKKTKHILRAAEFLRDLVAREVVTMRHVAGTVMLADLLTKACARPVFLELLKLLVSCSKPSRLLVRHVRHSEVLCGPLARARARRGCYWVTSSC